METKVPVGYLLPQVEEDNQVQYKVNAGDPGWLPCDGRLYSKEYSAYQELFGVLEYNYGGSSSLGLFRTPDMRVSNAKKEKTKGSKMRNSRQRWPFNKKAREERKEKKEENRGGSWTATDPTYSWYTPITTTNTFLTYAPPTVRVDRNAIGYGDVAY